MSSAENRRRFIAALGRLAGHGISRRDLSFVVGKDREWADAVARMQLPCTTHAVALVEMVDSRVRDEADADRLLTAVADSGRPLDKVPSGECFRRVREMNDSGIPWAEIARRSGLSLATMSTVSSSAKGQRRVTRATYDAVAAVYEEWRWGRS